MSMDPDLIAPEGKRCGAPGWVDDIQYRCLIESGHDGMHAAEPGPGETVAWPKESIGITGLIGPYGLKPDTPYDQQHQTSAYENREARRDAVELAVRALVPMAGAYIDTKQYGDQIIKLAGMLRRYIRDGDGLDKLAEANEREKARQAAMSPEELDQMHAEHAARAAEFLATGE